MTQPVAPGAPAVAVPATPVAARQGNVYLTSPITGETREVDPNAAVEMLRSGWVPNSESSAEDIRAGQIPGEVAAEQPALGKLGYGLARGALTPLVDLALPEGGRVHEVLSEDSPWLVGGGEAAGMLGSAILGVGPVAALEEGAGRVAAQLGAGNGLVRTAFGRAAQGALESGAYGVMGAISEAHDQNVPLTAQRLGSEVLAGLLFGGVLGGGFGAVEGGLARFAGKTGTLPERIAAVEQGKLDDIFKPGVSEEDMMRVGKREFGVKDPGMMQEFQAQASGGQQSPEFHALIGDSGPVGERMRKEVFFGQEKLAQAERDILEKGDDYLLARQEAMKQVSGALKGRHVVEMVGPGEAEAGDIAKVIRDNAGDLVNTEADWAKALERRGAFVDKALDHMDEHTIAELERSMGVARGVKPDADGVFRFRDEGVSNNLRERLLNGLAQGQKETIESLELALGKSGLTDDALHSLGGQGNWLSKPLEFMQKWKGSPEEGGLLGGLGAEPKGVNDAAGDFKKLVGNLEFREQGILRGNRGNAARELDMLKKRVAQFAKPGERLVAGDGVATAARAMYEDLRVLLEDPIIWGPKFAEFQAYENRLLHQNIGVAHEMDDLFSKTIGKPDPEDPWMNARVMDSGKVQKALADMSEPKRLEQLDRIRNHLDDEKRFFQKQLDSLNLGDQARVRIQAGMRKIDTMREAIDTGVYMNVRAKQARGLLGFGPLGSGWEARAALGAVVGGPVGAVAGLAMSAALNPGKMLQFRAIAERMAETSGSRVWRGISKLLGLQVGDVARETAGFVGKTAGRSARANGKVAAIVSAMLDERGDARARSYSQTVRQLAEAQQKLPELASKLDSTMPTLEQALPGTKQQMMAQAQRGISYVLGHLPVTPKMRLYGEQAAPLSDYDYEQFIRMAMAATDPPSILEMAEDGELTPDAVAAAEYAAPEFVGYIRSEMVRAISNVGPDGIKYENRISASLVLGTPLDESLEPDNIAIQQATYQKRAELTQERREKRSSGGSGGETGVNDRYQSKADQIEAGAPPR